MRVALALAAAVVAATAGSARAAKECEGLDVCISVPGPWVVVPAAPGGGVRRVEYQVTCPQGSVVAGLDAVLGDPRIDVTFLGALGSPVAPGITTARSALFVALWAESRPTFFRPYLGCLPTSGGGRGTTAVAPRPPQRLVKNLRVRAGEAGALAVACGQGRRLVSSSHAVGLRRRAEPDAQMLTAVSVIRRESGNRVTVRATRTTAVPAGVAVRVQVHALCTRDS